MPEWEEKFEVAGDGAERLEDSSGVIDCWRLVRERCLGIAESILKRGISALYRAVERSPGDCGALDGVEHV